MISKFAKITSLVLVFLLAAGAGAYLTLTFIIKSEDAVIVPDLVGKDVVSALEILSELQLNTKVSGSEYNQKFPTLPAGQLRHQDHRFEWSRAEFEGWATGIADRYGYRVRFLPVGDQDPSVGAPSQMGVFVR